MTGGGAHPCADTSGIRPGLLFDSDSEISTLRAPDFGSRVRCARRFAAHEDRILQEAERFLGTKPGMLMGQQEADEYFATL